MILITSGINQIQILVEIYSPQSTRTLATAVARTLCYNQLQKQLRHCTVFWHKWTVHDRMLVIAPPPLIKVASNTRSCSKLRGTTLNGREEGGQYYISLRPVTSSDLKQETSFFRGSVSTFLQLVVTKIDFPWISFIRLL